MDAVLYADDGEDDDADFRFTVMVEEAEIVAELAERIFGASHPLAKDAQKVLGRGFFRFPWPADGASRFGTCFGGVRGRRYFLFVQVLGRCARAGRRIICYGARTGTVGMRP